MPYLFEGDAAILRMTVDAPDLDPLFDPDSVAGVGASPDSFYAGNLIDNLLEYGYEGPLYPVNPKRDEVWGRTCYDDVADVPETVDLVVVSVPRDSVVDVVRAAGERGVPVALVIAAGFSEADERGAELEATSQPPQRTRASTWSGRTASA